MSLSAEQLQSITIATSITASLSIVCALGTILTYILLPRFRNTAAELVVYMAAAELIAMPAYLVGRAGPKAGPNSFLCQWQGVFEQIGDLSTMFWTSCIAIDLCLIMFKGWSIQQAAKLHKRHYMVVCTVVPLLIALVPLGFEDSKDEPFYNVGETWCWISKDLPMARLFCSTFHYVGRHIWKRAKYLKGLNKDSSSHYKTRFAKHVSLYLLAYAISRTPATINRLYSMAHNDDSSYILRLLHSIFTPSTGVFNFAVYAYIGWIDRMRSSSQNNHLTTVNAGSAKVYYTIKDSRNEPITITTSPPVATNISYVDSLVEEINAPEPFPSDESVTTTYDHHSPISPLFARVRAETQRQQQRLQNQYSDYISTTEQLELSVYNNNPSVHNIPSTRTRSAGHTR
ncbi:hypothetical protein BDF19DRAFT_424799 [Syncephalis fuscata]|nr:hypothetical protein BDF19DRAFT_424799 [Syncephalis fuscata]